MPQLTLKDFAKMYQSGEKIVMTTAYDASFATLGDEAGIEIFLVGDSLGMVIQGKANTLAVTMDEMVYHTRCVAQGARRALVLGDMPFGSYEESPQQAFHNAARLLAAGASMVKLEGGAQRAETVKFLVQRGIPVCGHIGLTPQSVHTLGGFRIQGRTEEAARRIIDDAVALEHAGAAMVVIETVPAAVVRELTAAVKIPTVGIGAGPHCSGQILVLYDLLDVFPGNKASFVRNFMQGTGSVQGALRSFVQAVKDGSFPAPEHCF